MGCSTLVLTKDCKAANFVAGGKSVTLNACGVLVRPIEELNLVGVGKMAAGTLENISGQPDADSWYPRPEDLTHSNVARLVRELELTDYDALYRFSVEKPGEYWRAVSRFCGMVWSKDFSHFDFRSWQNFARLASAASYRKPVPAQAVDATLACSLLAGVWKPKVFLGR